MSDYASFIHDKTQLGGNHGFEPTFMPDWLFPHEKFGVEWQVRKGRSAAFWDTGMGKTALQLCFAQNVVEHTNKPFIIFCPLGVANQTAEEAERFGIEASVSRTGKIKGKIVITNYQQMHKFSPGDFSGAALDESSILKNPDGVIKAQAVEFMRMLPYRGLYTATAAPNDFPEFGTSSEALGELGYMDMLGRFFKNAQNSLHPSIYRQRGQSFAAKDETAKWRFRGHAEKDFWRWMVSWARAARKPSDLGPFSDEGYILPPLIETEHIVDCKNYAPGFLPIDMPAVGLREQGAERARTIDERCELAAKIATSDPSPCVIWCDRNAEANLLEKLIPDAQQITSEGGKQTDAERELMIQEFRKGGITRLITKGSITGLGQNWQHCHRSIHFASNSFEKYYQSVRRFWRFGQKHQVQVHMIATPGERGILKNCKRKELQAAKTYGMLVGLMNNELKIERNGHTHNLKQLPTWIK